MKVALPSSYGKGFDLDFLVIGIIFFFVSIGVIYLIVGSALQTFTEKEYTIERPCIDERGGIFKDEMCEVTVRCSTEFPDWLLPFNSGDCKYVK